jgi:hypothetical protein
MSYLDLDLVFLNFPELALNCNPPDPHTAENAGVRHHSWPQTDFNVKKKLSYFHIKLYPNLRECFNS